MIKLIAMDLDGTLFSDDHLTVSEKNKETLKSAHEIGIKLAVATGRTVSTIGDICIQVPQIDYIMFSNGAGVYDRHSKKIIYKNCMPWNLADSILPFIENHSKFIEFYIDGKAYAQKKPGDEFPYEIIPDVFIKELGKGITVLQDFKSELNGRDVEKVIFYLDSKSNYEAVFDRLSSNRDIFVTSSVKSSIEFTKAGTDKGSALMGMCKYLNISESETMALGDAGNDIPMLKAAGYGIAMQNADTNTKESADFVTKSNTEDGVSFAIKKYALNE